jgi:hypothetical protein
MDIKFTYTDSIGNDGFFIDTPKPARLTIPNWYKDMPLTFDGKPSGLSVNSSIAPNTTAKACSPFLDALTSGYMYCLPLDVEVRKIGENDFSFKWRSKSDFIAIHVEEQYRGLPSPVELGGNQVLKWASPFNITTPEGYSTLFTHPLNRHELPFRTFSGVVDTDSYTSPVQFPFQMVKKVDDILIIEKGTPVCQIIPFKRDPWVSKTDKEDQQTSAKKRFNHHSRIVRSYKTNHWSKKSYE